MQAGEPDGTRQALQGLVTPAARARVAADLAARLRFQRELRRWPPPLARAPKGTPWVSLYEQGALRGCWGDDEGQPGERLARAFLRALHDTRFPPIRDRTLLAAECAYMHSAQVVDETGARERFEAGTHGIGLGSPGRTAALLLPAVARDGGLDARGMLAALADKAGCSFDGAELFLFEVDAITARQGHDARIEPASARAAKRVRGARDAFAEEWLERLIRPDGSIVFALDPRARTFAETGELHHARTSVVLRALGAKAPARAKERLARDARTALAGGTVRGWPSDASAVVGTLAHLVLAGIDLRRELHALARGSIEPWFAAQAAFALGRDAPESLWRTVVDDLRERPWAPWTALAATARGDRTVLTQAMPAIVRSLRAVGPHVGGCDVTPVPELALTALAVEAASGATDRAARAAVERGRAFLARWQLLPGAIPAALDPALAMGAFPASPIAPLLRCDVVAHVRLALGRREGPRADSRT